MRVRAFLFLAIGSACLCLVLPRSSDRADAAPTATSTTADPSSSVPVFAYYYIWFDPTSWNRAKRDYPLAGKYSSNDPAVMRKHIEWAKQAGITGFIVSWKNTPSLDRRLSTLVDIAEAEHFSLAIIYEGLNFSRKPLPAAQVGSDLKYFARVFASRKPFAGFSKPLVIWSGTWEFTAADVARETTPVRDQLTVLATERNVKGYERLADSVDGDAYYWSSVNPDTYPGYVDKLSAMGAAVHGNDGVWIAPAAPGFDARAIGGTTNVTRADGQTLLRECSAAYQSSPDLLGLISWNEFSENSYVEPSVKYGTRYLDVAKQCVAMGEPDRVSEVSGSDAVDSSSPGRGLRTGLLVAPLVIAVLSWAFIVVLRRSRQSRQTRRMRQMRRMRRKRRKRRRAISDPARRVS